jgi:hypothetical protein
MQEAKWWCSLRERYQTTSPQAIPQFCSLLFAF